MAGTEGGSGTRSMEEKRKASAQSVKVDTFEGDRLAGSSRAMGPGYAGGVTASAMAAAIRPGASSGPKWPRSG